MSWINPNLRYFRETVSHVKPGPERRDSVNHVTVRLRTETAEDADRTMPSLLLVLLKAQLGLSFVIAPPWADQDSNPCSKNSWQLVYWPPTKLCYQIFSR